MPLVSVPIPEVSPLRRGRMKAGVATVSRGQSEKSGEASFEFLDIRRETSFDEDASARYPSIEEFSLNMETAALFDFENISSPRRPFDSELRQQKVVDLLADEAFAEFSKATNQRVKIAGPTSRLQGQDFDMTATKEVEIPLATQRTTMVSQGTMTSPAHSPIDAPPPRSPPNQINGQHARKLYRSKSSRELQTQKHQQTHYLGIDLISVSDAINGVEGQQGRARGASVRSNSTGPSVESRVHGEASMQRPRPRSFIDKGLDDMNNTPLESREPDANHIESNVEFLRKLHSRGHRSRNDRGNRIASGSGAVHVPQVKPSGSRRKLAQTQYADVFNHFEQSGPETTKRRQFTRPLSRNSRRSPSLKSSSTAPDRLEVETEDIPDVVLQLEKRKSSQDSRWSQVDANTEPVPNKATSIQERVSKLLANADTPPRRVAHGYGPFTGDEHGNQSWDDDRYITQSPLIMSEHDKPRNGHLRPEPPPKPVRLGGTPSKKVSQYKGPAELTRSNRRFPALSINNT